MTVSIPSREMTTSKLRSGMTDLLSVRGESRGAGAPDHLGELLGRGGPRLACELDRDGGRDHPVVVATLHRLRLGILSEATADEGEALPDRVGVREVDRVLPERLGKVVQHLLAVLHRGPPP